MMSDQRGDHARPAVIGRDEELSRILEFVVRVPQGGRALLIEGMRGIGKTTLWEAALDRARIAGYTVVHTRPGEAESKPAFGGLIDLLGEVVDDVLGDLPEPQAVTLEMALLRRKGGVRHPDNVAIAASTALRALAARGPMVIGVDDFEWLDAPSRRVLLHVARRLGTDPVAVIATERNPGVLAQISGDRLTRLRLGPLGLPDLHNLVRQRLGVWLERPMLIGLAHACGGNPLYALEIVGSLGADGVATADSELLPIPATLRRLVSRRLAAVPAAAREALLVAFNLWRPTPDLVEQALLIAGHRPDGLAAAAEAEVVELRVDRVVVTDALLAAVLSARLGPSAHRALHARLARLALDPEEHAFHLARAAIGPDGVTADIAETSAVAASARGSPDTTVALLDLALRLTPRPDKEARIRRLDALAMANYMAGDSRRAVAGWEEIAVAAPKGPVRAHAVWRLVEFGSSTVPSGFAQAPDTLESILPEAYANPVLNANIEASLAEFHLYRSGPIVAEPHARAAMALAEDCGDTRTLAHALISRALTDYYSGRAATPEPLFERVLALEAQGLDVPTELLPSAYLAYLHVHAGDSPAHAAELLDEKLENAARDGDEASMPYLLWQRCEVAVASGQLDAADTYAKRCLEAVEGSGRTGRLGGALYCQALVHARLGRYDEAVALACRALELDEPRGVRYLVVLYRGVLGSVEMARGRHLEAVAWLAPAHRLLVEHGYSEPGFFRFVPDLVEALVALGRLDDAAAILAPYSHAARRLGRRSALAGAARAFGTLLAARGEPDVALVHLDRAVALENQLGRPFEEARCELVRGAVARRGRHKAVAIKSFARAAALFDGIGSQPWADQARVELARVSAGVAAAFELTATERRIAELLADGCSNPDIAAKLFMSRKTVERHLTNAFSRLGLHSRAELAALVAAERGATANPDRN
jgi:DNA-binding CsgD family transcriptional regulator